MKFQIRLFSFLLFLGLFFTPHALYAQNKGGMAGAKTPVKIQSDAMRYYGKDMKSVFSGNVVALSDNFTLTSDNVTVLLNKEMDVEKIICNGNVNFKTEDIVSISKDAEIDQKSEIAILSGGVTVWQGENILKGEKVTMYYAENRIVVNSGSKERVTVTFKPEDNATGKGLSLEPKSKKP